MSFKIISFAGVYIPIKGNCAFKIEEDKIIKSDYPFDAYEYISGLAFGLLTLDDAKKAIGMYKIIEAKEHNIKPKVVYEE